MNEQRSRCVVETIDTRFVKSRAKGPGELHRLGRSNGDAAGAKFIKKR